MRARLVIVASLGGSTAAAQSPPEAVEDLLRRGVELRREGRDAESLAAFGRAYALQRTPRTAAQWGLACQANARWVQAETLLREALAAPGDPWVARNRAALERALDVAGRHLATVDLSGGVDGARVRINGEAQGSLPLRAPLRVVAGTVVAELEAEGFEPLTLRFITAPGEVLRERVPMTPRPPPEPPPVAPPVAPPAALPEPPREITSPPPPPAQPPGEGASLRPWAVGAWIGAGALGVVGGVALALREDAVSAYNQQCDAGDARGPCGELRDRGQLSTGAAIVALPLAAVLGGAGVLLWTRPRRDARPSGLRCATAGLGVQCALRF